jgi:phosphoenolpyruvate phosphomutase
LAAGEGNRLKKYTEDLPKGMLDFMGKTLIERQILLFKDLGIKDIVIVKGYHGEKIKYRGVKYYYNKRFARTNMLVSLFCAERELNGELIICYADIIFGKNLLRKVINSDGDIVVAVDMEWKKYWKLRYGSLHLDTESLKMDSNGDILTLGRQDVSPSEIDGRFIGLLRFSSCGAENLKRIWHKFKDDFWDSPWQISGRPLCKAYMTDMLQALINEGCKVEALRTANGWIEFDTDKDYEKAIKWGQQGILASVLKIN